MATVLGGSARPDFAVISPASTAARLGAEGFLGHALVIEAAGGSGRYTACGSFSATQIGRQLGEVARRASRSSGG